MIRSCKNADTQKLVDREFCKKFAAIDKVARLRLDRLEKLAGDREGQYSIRINDQYRVCFEWKDGDAYNVEVVDYH
jgi:toxin HigB-1